MSAIFGHPSRRQKAHWRRIGQAAALGPLTDREVDYIVELLTEADAEQLIVETERFLAEGAER